MEEAVLEKAAGAFRVVGKIKEIRQMGSGHINSTYLVETQGGKYTLQMLNVLVFQHPEQVMSNIARVTGHIRKSGSVSGQRTISLVETKSGGALFQDEHGNFWRMYRFIDNVVSMNLPDTPETLRKSGVAFGRFAADLADFPGNELFETIPHFHDTPMRLQHFHSTIREDKAGRAEGAAGEISRILEREKYAGSLNEMAEQGRLPVRVTHNDTKLNNVLLDETTMEPVAVIDLDTIMPGLAAYDFGDAIRFGANTALEDERDTGKIHFSMAMFQAFASGYLQETGRMMTDDEISSLALGAWTMTYETAVRFLDDYIDGDNYFRVDCPDHNLVRAVNQLTLLYDMEKNYGEMQKAIGEIAQKI